MARINHGDSLFDGIDSVVVRNIAGNIYICPRLNGEIDLIFSGTGKDRACNQHLPGISVIPDMFDLKYLRHLLGELGKLYRLHQCADPSDPFHRDIVLIRDFQNFSVRQPQKVGGCIHLAPQKAAKLSI